MSSPDRASPLFLRCSDEGGRVAQRLSEGVTEESEEKTVQQPSSRYAPCDAVEDQKIYYIAPCALAE